MITETGTPHDFKQCLWQNVEHRRCVRGHVVVEDTDQRRHIMDIVDGGCSRCFNLWDVNPLEAIAIIERDKPAGPFTTFARAFALGRQMNYRRAELKEHEAKSTST